MIEAVTVPEGGQRPLIVERQSCLAVAVGCGETVRVVDLEGHQVGAMWAIDAADPGRWLSPSHTRDRRECLFPRIGEQFTDQ